jgi:hypothetical protein
MVNGIASFPDLTIDNPGNGYTLLFTFSGTTANGGTGYTATSDPFAVDAGVPNYLTFVEGIANGRVDTPFDVKVAVWDQFGRPSNTDIPISLILQFDGSAGQNAVLSGAAR